MLSAVLLGLAMPALGAEWTPVLNGTLSGGQYFFEKQRGNFSGNAALTAAGVAKINDRWSVMPMYVGSYRGTKGVDDGVGAGTLYQQQMDHTLSTTGIRKWGENWRLKPSLGYKREFLKETRDETWGKGLFDYEKISAGLEVENIYKDPFSWRAGLDFFRIRFPNYRSLESQTGTDPFGNPLGRELAPVHVLDTYNWQASVSGSRPFPAEDPVVVAQGAYSILYQDFADQKIVNAAGQFDDSARKDFLQTLSGSVGRPIPMPSLGDGGRLELNGSINFALNKSNQNTYDADFAKFVSDSYSYWTVGLGPDARVSWGGRTPSWASAALRFSRQTYLGRLVQDGAGVYGSAKQHHDRVSFGLGYGYPIAPNFTLTARTNFLWATSNHKYNKNYSYDYRAVNYLLGVTYEY